MLLVILTEKKSLESFTEKKFQTKQNKKSLELKSNKEKRGYTICLMERLR